MPEIWKSGEVKGARNIRILFENKKFWGEFSEENANYSINIVKI